MNGTSPRQIPVHILMSLANKYLKKQKQKEKKKKKKREDFRSEIQPHRLESYRLSIDVLKQQQQTNKRKNQNN